MIQQFSIYINCRVYTSVPMGTTCIRLWNISNVQELDNPTAQAMPGLNRTHPVILSLLLLPVSLIYLNHGPSAVDSVVSSGWQDLACRRNPPITNQWISELLSPGFLPNLWSICQQLMDSQATMKDLEEPSPVDHIDTSTACKIQVLQLWATIDDGEKTFTCSVVRSGI